MALEIISRLPIADAGKPPLLFVHGAWLGAWCWDEFFLGFFAEAGFPAFALSLRGHGGSSGALHFASMDDYVADLADVAKGLPSPPILIGHSMGGGVVQKYLERHAAPAALLLGSMPPHGMANAFLDAWRRHPLRFLQANLTGNTHNLFGAPDISREFFYTPETSDAEIARLMRRAGGESQRALLEMSLPNWIDPTRVKTRVAVMGGAKDVVIPPRDVLETARRYGVEAQILPEQPHAMMMDMHWRAAAAAVLAWLEQL